MFTESYLNSHAVLAHKNRFESDGLPFRSAPGQAAAQAERWIS